MNKINLCKQIGVLVLIALVLIALYHIDADFYKALMILIGGWTVGSFCGNFTRRKWPLYEKSGG